MISLRSKRRFQSPMSVTSCRRGRTSSGSSTWVFYSHRCWSGGTIGVGCGRHVATIPVLLYCMSASFVRFASISNPPGTGPLPEVVAMAVMAYALAPFNDSANTYSIYCVAVAPFTTSESAPLLVFAWRWCSAVYASSCCCSGFRPMLYGITSWSRLAAAASNYMLLRESAQEYRVAACKRRSASAGARGRA